MIAIDTPRRSLRQRAIRWSFWSQVGIAIAAFATACFELESIVVTGPLLAIAGLTFATLIRPLGSLAAVNFGLSAPIVSAIGAFMISFFHLGPELARLPIIVLLAIYLLFMLPAAFFIAYQLHRWPTHVVLNAVPRLRFSMKSLLGVMTIVAVATVVLTGAAKLMYDFPLPFAAFGCVTMSLAIAVAVRTFPLRGQSPNDSNSTPNSMGFQKWLKGIMSGTVYSQQRRCSFCGFDYRKAAPFVEGRDGSLICRACVIKSAELLQNTSPSSQSDPGQLPNLDGV